MTAKAEPVLTGITDCDTGVLNHDDKGFDKQLNNYAWVEENGNAECLVPGCGDQFKDLSFWRKHFERKHTGQYMQLSTTFNAPEKLSGDPQTPTSPQEFTPSDMSNPTPFNRSSATQQSELSSLKGSSVKLVLQVNTKVYERKTEPKSAKKLCDVCFKVKPRREIFMTDCQPSSHAYCIECVKDLFERSMKDVQLFPPRCCKKPILFKEVEKHLENGFMRQFQVRHAELTSKNPIYCHKNTCSRFVGSERVVDQIITCPDCQSVTCVLCKGKSHTSTCPEDPIIQQLVELRKKEGWQQCPGCKNLIEHLFGCWHMTCRCGYDFCYLCSKNWKTCRCPSADDARMLSRAEYQARRSIQHNARAVFESDRILFELRRLRRNIACTHNHWLKLELKHRSPVCEIHCGSIPPEKNFWYIMECDGCGIQACKWCHHNRLRARGATMLDAAPVV